MGHQSEFFSVYGSGFSAGFHSGFSQSLDVIHTYFPYKPWGQRLFFAQYACSFIGEKFISSEHYRYNYSLFSSFFYGLFSGTYDGLTLDGVQAALRASLPALPPGRDDQDVVAVYAEYRHARARVAARARARRIVCRVKEARRQARLTAAVDHYDEILAAGDCPSEW